MGKVELEVCLISARGLRRTSSFWKLQWFAVGWIDPDIKYCTKIDASGNASPVWKTKFSTTVDLSESKLQDLALHVEVYSREPIFLRESLLGSSTVALKEFLDKFNSESDFPKPVEEVGSFQLRRKSSSKPLGFVDVSIRVSEHQKDDPGNTGAHQVVNLGNNSGGINVGASGYGSLQFLRPHMPLKQPEISNAMSHPPSYSYHYRDPPHPAVPTTSSYVNMPSSVGGGGGPGFGMGVGAGAVAGGAVMFGGGDFISGFDVPAASLYPPF